MKVISGLSHIHGLSLALGFFDGVHIGHSIVIKNAVKFAKDNNKKSGVILFSTHPKEFFNGEKFNQIVEFNDKLEMLNKLEVDYVFILDFDINIANMKASSYMENIILPFLRPCAITTGFNHTFGVGGEGNPALLEQYSKDFDFQYFQIPPITTDGITISSTTIRNAIKNSDFDSAKKLLGYDFYFKSPVVHGRQIGRTINFPTANLVYPENIVQIENGVYFVFVNTNSCIYRGVMNYGLRPTIDKNDLIPTPEVHLLDFSGNLYGSIIKVSLIAKIRDEKHFSSLTELKEQISKDCKFAKMFSIPKYKIN